MLLRRTKINSLFYIFFNNSFFKVICPWGRGILGSHIGGIGGHIGCIGGHIGGLGGLIGHISTFFLKGKIIRVGRQYILFY